MNDSAVFISKKGKKMQHAQIQIGEDVENNVLDENNNHEKELINININEKEKQENILSDELNNIDAENIISNDEVDLNLNEKENEIEQNQEEKLNNENNDNYNISKMNYSAPAFHIETFPEGSVKYNLGSSLPSSNPAIMQLKPNGLTPALCV